MSIHVSAIIENGASIDPSAEIGPYAVIGQHVKIGNGTKIGAHSIVDGHTTIGDNCQIFAGVSIGLAPQDVSYKDEPTGVLIGDRVTVREYATIHRATKEGYTVVGDDCFIMNHAHVAHNCQLGCGVVMANSAILAGYVTVGDHTVMGGLIVVHQFARIGRLTMISGLSGTRLDLPPFSMCDGRPARVRGINRVGMRRQKIPQNIRLAINQAYKVIYRSEDNLSQALERIEREIELYPEIQEILDFYKSTKRGVIGKVAVDEESDFGDQ